MKLTDLESAVESILFAIGEAVEVSDIAKSINQDIKTAKLIVDSLKIKLETENRGLSIIELENSYQMCTSAKNFDYVRNILKSPKKSELTQPVLETLAIIAYKQPVTRSDIEEIRGVSADHAVNKLFEKNLICEVGRSNLPGRPILLGTTDEFLRCFGFKSVKELSNIE